MGCLWVCVRVWVWHAYLLVSALGSHEMGRHKLPIILIMTTMSVAVVFATLTASEYTDREKSVCTAIKKETWGFTSTETINKAYYGRGSSGVGNFYILHLLFAKDILTGFITALLNWLLEGSET